MSYGTDYLDIAELNPKRVGRTFNKMSNKSTVTEAPKASRKYNKTRGEHFKDIVIAILVAGIVAFVGGVHFADQQHGAIANAVKAAVAPSASAQAPTSK